MRPARWLAIALLAAAPAAAALAQEAGSAAGPPAREAREHGEGEAAVPEAGDAEASGREGEAAARGEAGGDPAARTAPAPVYVPPERGSVRVRVGAATRGERPDLPAIVALAPDHVARTVRAQPTLCWLLTEPTDVRVDVVLRDERSVEPLLELVLHGDVAAGVHRLRLADHGVSLEEGRVYQWFVSLVPDPTSRASDVIASGAIQRVQPDRELAEALRRAPDDAWEVYARHGLWYDALAALGERIAAGATHLRGRRAALLEQVGLPRAAAYDRAVADG